MTLEPIPYDGRVQASSNGGGGLFGGAGKMVGWAARTSFGIAKQLPGVEAAERGIQQLERAALTELRKRIDEVADPFPVARPLPRSLPAATRTETKKPGNSLVTTQESARSPLRAAMADLLERSLDYSETTASSYLFSSILNQLTPDEARIVSALSDGSPFPLVDVAERAGVNGVGRYLLRNASSVGKAAGVTLPSQVPQYITRLIALGVAEIDEEALELSTQYEILLTDEQVREAQANAKRPKIIRRTVHISRFGAEFWKACDPAAG